MDGPERICARRRWPRSTRRASCPAQGRNRIALDDREPARLVRLAPARLGRADRVFVDKADRRAAARPGGDRARRRRRSSGGRRCLVHRAAAALPRQRLRPGRLREGRPTSSTSGSTPARPTPSCSSSGPSCTGRPTLYLEGSDQHRGWFHSSLLESCGTRGRAPYEAVLTHGFVLDEQGRKMSKSLGNVIAPQEVMKTSTAPTSCACGSSTSDYAEDLRIGPEILKQQADAYRRLRNTLRYLLGSLAGFTEAERVPRRRDAGAGALGAAPPGRARRARARARSTSYDFHGVYPALHNFCAVDLSAFYFDIRKDALYCDAARQPRRRAARTVLDELFSLPDRLARAGPVLHRRGGLARPASPDDGRQRASATFPDDRRPPGATRRWARAGSGCATCAASSPARSSSSAPRSASAPACRPRRASTSRAADLAAAAGPRPRRALHHQRHRAGRGRRAARAPSRCADVPGVGRGAGAGRGRQMRALLAGAAGGRRRAPASISAGAAQDAVGHGAAA